MGNIELIKLNLNKSFRIEIPIEIYASLLEYRQMASEPEAGGIFVGKRLLNKTILVVDISKPESDDLRGRFTFSKTSPTHQQFADDYFDKSSGFISLIGEWHTHPEDHPHPSGLDRSEWNRLSAQRRDKRPMLAVIVGRQSLYVELVPSTGRGSVLIPVE